MSDNQFLAKMVSALTGANVVADSNGQQSQIRPMSVETFLQRCLTRVGGFVHDDVAPRMAVFPRGNVIFQLSPEFRDQRYDYDLTSFVDTTEYWRGSRRYYRPCGWKRIALNVNKYSDKTWLGTSYGAASTPGEWEVAYHGTESCSALKISQMGYDPKRLKRNVYGAGIYSAPNIEVAELYAIAFEVDKVRYKAVLQNRVNPATRKIVPKETTRVGEYWVTPPTHPDDIRAYGICYKRV